MLVLYDGVHHRVTVIRKSSLESCDRSRFWVIDKMRVLSTGGGRGKLPSKRLSFPPPKSSAEKKFTAINTIFSKFSGGECPRTPLEGLQKIFSRLHLAQKVFQARLPPPTKNPR